MWPKIMKVVCRWLSLKHFSTTLSAEPQTSASSTQQTGGSSIKKMGARWEEEWGPLSSPSFLMSLCHQVRWCSPGPEGERPPMTDVLRKKGDLDTRTGRKSHGNEGRDRAMPPRARERQKMPATTGSWRTGGWRRPAQLPRDCFLYQLHLQGPHLQMRSHSEVLRG